MLDLSKYTQEGVEQINDMEELAKKLVEVLRPVELKFMFKIMDEMPMEWFSVVESKINTLSI